MNERVLESNNVYSRFALVQWRHDTGPYWVVCLDYADIVQVKRYPVPSMAYQLGWNWVHKGQIEEKQTNV